MPRPSVPNVPPVWQTVPTISFVQGVASNHDVAQYVSDSDTLVITKNAQALPSGVTYDQAQQRYEYDGVGAIGGTNGHILTADDAGEVSVPVWESRVIDIHLNNGQSFNLNSAVSPADKFEIVATQAPTGELIATNVSLDTSTGVISSTYSGATTYRILRVRAKNGSANGALDASEWWSSTAATALNTATFPNDASVRSISDVMGGDEASSQWDTSVTAFGHSGSLRQTILDTQSYPGHPANWGMPLHPDNTTRFGTGQAFTILIAYKVNRAWLWRPSGSGGKKFHIIANPPTGPDSNHTVSVTGFTRVMQDSNDEGYPQGYYYYSGGLSLWEQAVLSGTDLVRQRSIQNNGTNPLNGNDPATGAAWSAHKQDRAEFGGLYSYRNTDNYADGLPDPVTGAFIVPFEQTFLIEETIVPGTPGSANTYRRTRGLHPGQNWVTMYENSAEDINGGSPTFASLGGFGGFHITNSTTGMNAEPGVRPTINMWTLGCMTFSGSVNVPVLGRLMKSADAIVVVRLN